MFTIPIISNSIAIQKKNHTMDIDKLILKHIKTHTRTHTRSRIDKTILKKGEKFGRITLILGITIT